MTSYYTANTNFGNYSGSPMKSPPSENSLLARYFHSGQPSDQSAFSSPNRPIMNYNYNNHSGSGGGGGASSAGSNRTPFSSMEKLQLSPLSPAVKVEEDVLVMDGVLVDSKAKGGEGGSGGGENYSSSSPSSGGIGGGSLYKTELCKAWEVSGNCRYGYKCQFAHGQEEMRANPKHPRNRNRSEMSKSSSSTLVSPYSPRSIFSLESTQTTPSAKTASTSTLSNVSSELSKNSSAVKYQTASPNWSPLDDSIPVKLAGSTTLLLTREVVDDHIGNVLYGPTTHRKRLPVFRDICPE